MPTLPNGLTGTYYVVVQTSGPYQFIDTGDNSAVSVIPVVVALTPPPDLTPTLVEATAPGSPVVLTTASAGSKIDVTWTVQNIGPGDADGTWTDDVQIAAGGRQRRSYDLGSFMYSSSLQVGMSYTRTEQVQLPVGVQGVFQFVLTTDATGSLFEGGATANNTFTGPDLLTISIVAQSHCGPAGRVGHRSVDGAGRRHGRPGLHRHQSGDRTGQWAPDRQRLPLPGRHSRQHVHAAWLFCQPVRAHAGPELPDPDRRPGHSRTLRRAGLPHRRNQLRQQHELDPNTDNTFVSPITVTPFPPADLVTSNVAAPVRPSTVPPSRCNTPCPTSASVRPTSPTGPTRSG